MATLAPEVFIGNFYVRTVCAVRNCFGISLALQLARFVIVVLAKFEINLKAYIEAVTYLL